MSVTRRFSSVAPSTAWIAMPTWFIDSARRCAVTMMSPSAATVSAGASSAANAGTARARPIAEPAARKMRIAFSTHPPSNSLSPGSSLCERRAKPDRART